MTADLVIQALNNAVCNVGIEEGMIFHSDLGSQYTSNDYTMKKQHNLYKNIVKIKLDIKILIFFKLSIGRKSDLHNFFYTLKNVCKYLT